MKIFTLSFIAILMGSTSGFCTEVISSPKFEHENPNRVKSPPPQKTTSPQTPQFSQEELERLMGNAHSPKNRSVKKIDQETDVIYYNQ